MSAFTGKRWSFPLVLCAGFAFGAFAQAPTSPILNSPTNGTTGTALSLVLAWGPVSNATSYSLQVSVNSNFTGTPIVSQTGLGSSSSTIAGLASSTTYYWRASATNASGTSAWSSVWNFSTAGIPTTPTLVSPANNAQNQLTTLAFTWNTAARAFSYTLQLSTAQNFASTILDQAGIATTSAPETGLALHTTYYWRVQAVNDIGASAWSGVRTFTTTATPGDPMPVSPVTNAQGLGTTVTLTWNVVPGATSYSVQLSTTFSFSTTVSNITGLATDSVVVAGLANSSTYFWRVESIVGTGSSPGQNISWFSVGTSAVRFSVSMPETTPSFKIENGVLSYSLKHASPVQIAVFDLRGRSVFAWSDIQSGGNYTIDLANRSVALGRYLVWFKSGDFEKRTAMSFSGMR